VDVVEALGLAAAGFGAGAVNAVAGGGTLISFPALVAAGYPAKVANVTNTVAIWPGYLGSSLNYREELGHQRRRLLSLLAPAVVGAIGGSALLLSTPEDAFETLAPVLILFATLLLAFQRALSKFVDQHHPHDGDGQRVPALLQLAIGGAAVYGAYFGAGLSILTFAVMTILLAEDAQRLNALKGMISLLVNGVAFGYFAIFGPVEWEPALVMAGAALAGGYLGAGVARRIGAERLRAAIVVTGVIVSVAMILD